MEAKKITLQYGTIHEMIRPEGLLSNIFLKEYPATLALRLGMLQKELSPIYNDITQAVAELYKKYATKSVDPNGIEKLVVLPINQKSFDDDVNKIMMQTVEVEFMPIMFAEIKNLSFTPLEIVSLQLAGLLA